MTVGITRWNPGNDLFNDRFARIFDQMFERGMRPSTEETSNRNWLPAMDIRETSDDLIIEAELAGVKKEDVSLSLENSVLTISGERKFEKDVEKESYHRIERAYGAFSRSFTLPRNVRVDEAKANFNDGVLTVTLPKVDEAKPRRLEIQ
jgi:HSP20 family protein